MLIFPIEKKPDWRNPPIITIVIILLNVCIFLFYQSEDKIKTQRALNHYIQSDLIEYEYDLTVAYLLRKHPMMLSYLQSIQREHEHQAYFALLVFSLPELDQLIAKQWVGFESAQLWSDRQKFEELRNDVSHYKFGLVPAETAWYNFVTYAFLHGSWEHLVGNMAFLFLFGFLLELKLGRLLYLLVYGSSSIFGGLLFQLVNAESYVPLVGASGAVSGLMGAYIVFYGLRKIRFFYCIGFYFGEMRAPAIAVMPLWLAKEIYGYYFLSDQVAYTAHLGGLLSGATVLAFIRFFGKKCSDGEDGYISEEVMHRLDAVLSSVSKYSANLDVAAGIACCQKALTEFPNDVRLLKAYFSLAKLQKNSNQFHEVSFDILRRALTIKEDIEGSKNLIRQVLRDYATLSSKPIVIQHDALMARIAHYLIVNSNPEDGIKIIKNYRKIKHMSKRWEPAIDEALSYCQKIRKGNDAILLNNMLSTVREAS